MTALLTPQSSALSPDSKIYVAGHRGLVGSAIVRALKAQGFDHLILRRSAELDLRNQASVDAFFAAERPEYVFLAAAKVGGIYANDTYPADFIRDNLQIQTNVIDAAYRNGVKRLLFLGSSCIYPKLAPQPMPESCLLTGELEPTNEWYAIAKIAGVKMCQAYHKQFGFDAISAMPTNLYGPNDNFDLEKSHVLPALIRKFHLAKLAQAGDIEAIRADELRHGQLPDDILHNLGLSRDGGVVDPSGSVQKGQLRLASSAMAPRVVLWGSGSPYREFLHVDDMAAACLFLMQGNQLQTNDTRLFNVGMGSDLSIKHAAELVQRVVGYDGEVIWDASKPDGTPRKLMDVSRLNDMGWQAAIQLEEGITAVYAHYCT
ncbi:MAG: GDP-fucose synthetase [Zetaproteobacteria bacterium CG12_big_fil_rev_8_21_14_0_65_54_13]|nr:MAG: GDP-fucose synthetase [Zetaproteobacteria bacterium CG12_big_fil_rev_8_21_14_0_65_54_13]PIX54068.1 MAG: GDP-fucose synthetase [Zetaproteobacteria bacterium CG_4_10_14_3_um_filter_54_28]PJA28896.1 MAG: GDP-fucose synthetase [Zetaproteobacteria bacterium CG_4_9_14_3_um_filter_54_145]